MGEADFFIPVPAIPEADEEVVWFDTKAGGYKSSVGVIGDMFFDEDVTLLVRTAPEGGELRIMNGPSGVGEVIPADTPAPLAVKFLGHRTQIALRVGSTPPTVWHANARVTEGDF